MVFPLVSSVELGITRLFFFCSFNFLCIAIFSIESFMKMIRVIRKFSSTARTSIVKSKYQIPELENGAFKHVSVPKFILSRIGKPALANTECLVDGTVDHKLSMTFGQTNAAVQKFATALTNLGIKPNSTVALLSPNHIDYFTVFMGVGLVGARTTPVNPLATPYEIEYQLEATDAKLIVADKCCLQKALEVGRKRSIPVLYLDTAELPSSPAPSDPLIVETMSNVYKSIDGRNIDPNAFFGSSDKFDTESIFMLPFSSGTTGKPKGVMLTHNNITSNILQYFLSEGYALNPDERNNNTRGTLLIPLPFFHIYGLVLGLMGPLYATGKVVLMSSFDLKKYLDNLQTHRATRTYIVPPIVLSLIKDPLAAGYDLSSLQCILTAAAPLGKDVQIEAMEKLKCLVKQGWGLTETSPIATLFPDWVLRRKDGSVNLDTLIGRSGRLVANMEGKVIDPETGSDLPIGEIGEICVRGPNVMKGYFNNEEATKNTIDANGWLHTGMYVQTSQILF